MSDILPGSPTGDKLPGAYHTKESLAASLDEVENVAADIEKNIKIALAESVADVATAVEGIKSNIIGDIGNRLDDAEKLVGKLQTKQLSSIRNGLTGVYADLVRLGIPVPTIEQVQYGLATGDYIGSVITPMSLPAEPAEVAAPADMILPAGNAAAEPAVPLEAKPPAVPAGPLPVGVGRPINAPGPVPPPPSPIGLPPVLPGASRPTGRPPNMVQNYVLCYNQQTGRHEIFNGDTCPVGYIAGCWDSTGGGIPALMSTDNTLAGCPLPQWQGVDPPSPPLQGNGSGPGQVGECPEGYAYFDWDGVTPLPFGSVADSDGRICIPHPATQTATCPLPGELACGTEATFPAASAQLGQTDNYCDDLDQFIQAIPSDSDISDVITAAYNSVGDSTWAKIITRAITGSEKPVVASVINSLGQWLSEGVKNAIQRSTCDKTALAPIASVNAIFKFLNQWFGVVPRATTQTMQQAENMTCQTVMPDQASADKAYLANEISKDVWDCWTKLGGNVIKAAEKGPETLRTRPTSEQVSKLYRRKQLTEDEFKKRMRQGGVIHDADREAIHNLTQDWPSLSDLTPWIVRDVFDEKTIDWAEVDRLFEDKYTEESKKYFDAIGLTKEVVKYYWRAHFHLPSFTMASEMYHRFRHLPEGDPLRTDLKRVKGLLIQDDWHPDWIDRMLAITFRPMRLIDIRSSYDLRLIDEEGLKEKLRILGYSDEDVATTFRLWERRRDIRDAKQGGFPSIKTLISQYANCEIDDHTFRYIVSFIVETPEQEQKAVEAAQIARQSEDYRRTISGVSWQYRRGLISEEEANAALSQQGIDPSCVPSLVRTWKAQASQKPKQLAAGSLCKMLEQGIISQSEFVNALIRIGYSAVDAQRIVNSCAIGLTQKEMRRANQEAARLAREQKAIEREAAKRRRLEECGPPACPKSRQTGSQNGVVGQ